jgi:hypothetical protein
LGRNILIFYRIVNFTNLFQDFVSTAFLYSGIFWYWCAWSPEMIPALSDLLKEYFEFLYYHFHKKLFLCVVLEFELRAWCLLGRCSTPSCFLLVTKFYFLKILLVDFNHTKEFHCDISIHAYNVLWLISHFLFYIGKS